MYVGEGKGDIYAVRFVGLLRRRAISVVIGVVVALGGVDRVGLGGALVFAGLVQVPLGCGDGFR